MNLEAVENELLRAIITAARVDLQDLVAELRLCLIEVQRLKARTRVREARGLLESTIDPDRFEPLLSRQIDSAILLEGQLV